MNLPSLLNALQTLCRDTFAQARAAGVTWGLLAVTLVCTLFCLGTSITGEVAAMPTREYEDPFFLPKDEVERMKLAPDQARAEGVDVSSGELHLFFGTIRVPLARPRLEAVRLIQTVLAGGVADTAGVLLCLLWTASFLPGFLEPAAASVMFAKPLARWTILVGKFVGVIATVGVQAIVFITTTWIALGIRTGVWEPRYFLAVPLLVVHFAQFFAISAALAVATRSTVACALGSLAAWLVCFGINALRHDAIVRADAAPAVLEAAYWLTPKPLDMNLILAEGLASTSYFVQAVDVRALNAKGGFQPELSLATSLLLPALLLTLAGRQLSRADY